MAICSTCICYSISFICLVVGWLSVLSLLESSSTEGLLPNQKTETEGNRRFFQCVVVSDVLSTGPTEEHHC